MMRLNLAGVVTATLMLALSIGLLAAAPASAAIPFDLGAYEDSWLSFRGEDFEEPAEPGGYRPGEGVGARLAAGCDVTGDDVPDLTVGAPFATVGGTAEVGRAYVVPGSATRGAGEYSLAGGPPPAGAIAISGRTDRVGTGAAVACAGDVNGDGDGDLLVGEWGGNDTNYGFAAFVVFGGDLPAGGVDLAALGNGGFEIWDSSDAIWPGSRLAGIGDVTGDGKDDVAIGDGFGNVVVVVAGKADAATVDIATPTERVMTIEQPALGDQIRSIAGAGDVDGDGTPDILVGVPFYSGPNGVETGAAYAVSGTARGDVDLGAWDQPASGVLFPVWGGAPSGVANSKLVWTGSAVAAAGDVNDDGLADLAIGAPSTGLIVTYPGSQHGSASIVFGKAAGGAVDLAALGSAGYTIRGPAFSEYADRFGGALASAGDVDGDGRDDLLIGSPGFVGPAGIGAGAAYLVYGRPAAAGIVDVAALECGEGSRIVGDAPNRGLGIGVGASTGFAAAATPELVLGAGTTSPESVGSFVRVIPLADVPDACKEEEPPPAEEQPEADWGFRENFRRYVTNGFNPAAPAVPIAASAGAFCPSNPDTVKGGCDPKLKALPADPAPRGALRFTPIGAGATDGSDTAVATQGRVTFRYPGHFFTLKLEDPWFVIEDNEVTVRARMDLDVDPSFTAYQSADVRVDLGTFPLAGPAEITSDYVTWETGPGILTPEAATALGNFLGTGAELDPVTLTIPRSLGELPVEPGVPDPDPVTDPDANKGLGGGTATVSTPLPPAAAPLSPAAPKGRTVGEDGVARLGKLSCAAENCAITAPRRVAVKIDGVRFWAKVLAPKTLGKGQEQTLRVKLPKAALTRLEGRSAKVAVKLTIHSGERSLVKTMTIWITH